MMLGGSDVEEGLGFAFRDRLKTRVYLVLSVHQLVKLSNFMFFIVPQEYIMCSKDVVHL